MSYKGGDRAEFGIISTIDYCKDYGDEYSPEKYHCIAICDEALNNWWEHLADMDTYFHTYKRPEKGLARWGITLIPPSSIPQLRHVIETYTETSYKADASEIISLLDKAIKNNSFVIHYGI